MAVHNGRAYLRPAIESILEQTFTNFRFLIVDDASTDDTREIVGSYSDERIEVLFLDVNVGQPEALNQGLHHASTKWIARMDADDYSAPTRFEEQMKAISEDPSLFCLGTYGWVFRHDPAVTEGEIATPLVHEDIVQVVTGSPIIHGTIFIDRQALIDVGGYDKHFRILADVEMYDRFLPEHKTAAIPSQLLGVRRHRGQYSNSSAAFDESIEISSNRLAQTEYSSARGIVIRADISHNLLMRARYAMGRWRLASVMKDVFSAFRLSPKKFPIKFFTVFVIYSLSEPTRGRIKRILRRDTSLARS
jgi:glycosyltransferase involved in cell wall biosynthesis